MTIAARIARTLLGVIFTLSGISGFLPIPLPPTPGLAGDFQDLFFASHWVQFVDGIEFVIGIALLFDQYVPLALVALAAIIFNMYVFHITLQPLGLPAPILMTVLWILVAMRYRESFAGLLVKKALNGGA